MSQLLKLNPEPMTFMRLLAMSVAGILRNFKLPVAPFQTWRLPVRFLDSTLLVLVLTWRASPDNYLLDVAMPRSQ